jgi:DNA-binding transcriptional MerR regulator
MLNYLDRTGVLRASMPEERRRGRRRRYSFADVLMLRIIAGLLRAGVEVARVREALASLQRHLGRRRHSAGDLKFLVTDGKRVYRKNENATLETLDRDGQFAFTFVLDVASAEASLRAEIEGHAGARIRAPKVRRRSVS